MVQESRQGDIPTLLGVTTSGLVRSCLPGDNALDLDVSAYQKEILELIGNSTTCPATHTNRYPILAESGNLDELHDRAVYVVPIDTELRELIVSMNGEQDENMIDFGLVVSSDVGSKRKGSCLASKSPQFASCRFSKPRKGNWTVEVRRRAGRGAFQVIVNRKGDD